MLAVKVKHDKLAAYVEIEGLNNFFEGIAREYSRKAVLHIFR